jgi:UDP-N-acetylglucosamine--N-acetylmuramyl-(pentapeptide) pyrophosphoryl-undecaprenol N-acetylglucosamine transferase
MKADMPTALVMAGGTGGHIYPGLAVADELRGRGWRVVWLGNADGMESRIVPPRGYELQSIRFTALRGKGLLRKLMLPLNLLRGFWQALRVLARVRPQVVLGLGGYVTFPGGMMASLRGIPLVLHEQNSIAGLANRVLARVADRVLTGFPDALPHARWTGNPVRADIAALPAPEQRFAGRSGPLNILVVGGSLGAQVLNVTVPRALAGMPEDARAKVTHQAGERNMAELEKAYAAAGITNATLKPFIEDMATAYAQADLVICRAGALTVAELAAAGVAAILVPLPHAVDDHQSGNARFLADRGAALLVPQNAFDATALAALIGSLDRPRLLDMAQRARALSRPGASADVADVCAALARKERKS